MKLESPTGGVPLGRETAAPLSVRDALRGKNVLLIGGTGFIGKVWLANLLTELPEIGRVYLLVRHNRQCDFAAKISARHRRVAGI